MKNNKLFHELKFVRINDKFSLKNALVLEK